MAKNRLLLGEDNVRKHSRLFLDSGFDVDGAATGGEIRRLMTRNRYDGAVLQTPMASGTNRTGEWPYGRVQGDMRTVLDLLPEIQRQARPPAVWIVAAIPDTQARMEYTKFPCVKDYTEKPVDVAQLLADVRRYFLNPKLVREMPPSDSYYPSMESRVLQQLAEEMYLVELGLVVWDQAAGFAVPKDEAYWHGEGRTEARAVAMCSHQVLYAALRNPRLEYASSSLERCSGGHEYILHQLVIHPVPPESSEGTGQLRDGQQFQIAYATTPWKPEPLVEPTITSRTCEILRELAQAYRESIRGKELRLRPHVSETAENGLEAAIFRTYQTLSELAEQKRSTPRLAKSLDKKIDAEFHRLRKLQEEQAKAIKEHFEASLSCPFEVADQRIREAEELLSKYEDSSP